MLSNQKRKVEKILDPITEKLSGVNPNIITLLGSIPSILFFVFVLKHLMIYALIVYIGNIFDLLDGMIARKYRKTTKFGGLLDSTLDRVSDFFVITPFSFAGLVRWEISVPLLLFSYLTSYIRAQGGVRDGGNSDFAAGVGIIERSERLIMIFFAIIIYLFLPRFEKFGFNILELSFLAINLLSLYTVIERMAYSYKKL